MNTYEVKIGRLTTRGNFQEIEKFVATSEEEYQTVYPFLRAKYSPLMVEVNIVQNIVGLEIPKEEEKVIATDTFAQPRPEAVKKFVRHYYTYQLGNELKQQQKELNDLRNDFVNKRAALKDAIETHLLEINKNIACEVNIKDEDKMCSLHQYKVEFKLTGELSEIIK